MCLLFWLLSTGGSLIAQDTTVLDFDTFIETVREHHPLALQAEIIPEQAQNEIRMARGAFDPKLQADKSFKDFDGKTYYDIFSGGMKVPTWFGLEFYGGFEQNQGIFLNPERTVPDGGLAHAGVSLPIGRGLFIDERRATLRKAQISLQSSRAERIALLNDLLFEAGKTYWDWFNAYQNLLVYQNAQGLAEVRRAAVKQGAVLGDRALVDTLEADIQVQNRVLSVQEAILKFENATAKLELFLWRDGRIPLELEIGSVPLSRDDIAALLIDTQFQQALDSLIFQHPELAQSRFKLEQLNIEQRLKREMLKPQLDVKYNFLTEPVGDSWLNNFNTQNYNWGFTFSLPLFLRKERAALALNRQKIDMMNYELDLKEQALATKARLALNTWNNSFQQSELAERQVDAYLRLLDAERRMFRAGESSLFLINSRESSYVQAQIKFLKALTENQKAILESRYRFALLSQ